MTPLNLATNKRFIICTVVASIMFISSFVYLYNGLRETELQTERNRTFLNHMALDYNISLVYTRDLGWHYFATKYTEKPVWGYALCGHGDTGDNPVRCWRNVTFRYDDFAVINYSHESYVYCGTCGEWVAVRYYCA